MSCNEKKKGCQKPENLTGEPEDCTPEQIRKCHGDTVGHPCTNNTGCEHPDQLKNDPGKCSPQQVRKCHGENAEHPCEKQ